MSYPDRFSERVAQATTAEEIRDILKDEVGLSMTDALMLVSQHARVFDRPLLMLILVIDRANPALALNPHLGKEDAAFAAEFLASRIIRNDPPRARLTFAEMAKAGRIRNGPWVERMIEAIGHAQPEKRARTDSFVGDALVPVRDLTSEQIRTIHQRMDWSEPSSAMALASLEVMLAAHPAAPPDMLPTALAVSRQKSLNSDALMALVARDDVRTVSRYRRWLFKKALPTRDRRLILPFLADDLDDSVALLDLAFQQEFTRSAPEFAEDAFPVLVAAHGPQALETYLAHDNQKIRLAAIAALGAARAAAAQAEATRAEATRHAAAAKPAVREVRTLSA